MNRAARRAAAAVIAVAAATPRIAAARPSERFDITGNGQPAITGGLGAQVNGVTDALGDLVLMINFGEVSPSNRNRIVRVQVPLALRARAPYQLVLTVSAAVSGDPNAVQLGDVGFGLQNLRRLGGNGMPCGVRSVIHPPYDNDPALNVTTAGRARYRSSLATLGSRPAVILNGPQLSRGAVSPRQRNNGWGVDAIFTVVPQFYSTGTFQVTLTFSMEPGPPVGCESRRR